MENKINKYFDNSVGIKGKVRDILPSISKLTKYENKTIKNCDFPNRSNLIDLLNEVNKTK